MSYCSDITKNRILECAKEEFLDKGFEKAQVTEIAKLAKVTTGAIYRHFKNKEALFFALIEEVYNYTLNVVADVENRNEYKTIRIDSGLVDNEAIIEDLFSETMLFVDYMYAHFNNFKLIFECSKGSRVENFIEEIVERYTAKNMKLVHFNAKQERINTEIKEFEVHVITKGYITSLCECVLHSIPYEDVREYIRSIVVFQYYGWRGLMNRKEK
ncbi:MAG: TetR/AcrR family transcriptional regulator [Peptostreptococcaceae bacterium]|nr:TetR/AcrR family transcriptional regulator [Peptostreptococcaceae bacterium]